MTNKFSNNQLGRYPIYLKYFKELLSEGVEFVSSPRIAAKLGYSEEQVRKDLQAVSLEAGRPKKGRSVKQLVEDLESFLGYHEAASAVLIGCGHLGGALLNFPAFEEMGLQILAGFDSNPELVNKTLGGKMVFPVDRLPELMGQLKANIAILTVPASYAQGVCDLAIASGAKAIWNFAPVQLEVKEGVVVENVNLASSLAVLSHRLNVELAKEEK